MGQAALDCILIINGLSVLAELGSVHYLELAAPIERHLCRPIPVGLVPVIREVDKKSIWQLAEEMLAMAAKARDRKLSPMEMQGGCFTISSLGNIGGTGFTPIVNAPEVGIVGVSNAAMKPVWDGDSFVHRKLLPLAPSSDHWVINGGDGGRS